MGSTISDGCWVAVTLASFELATMLVSALLSTNRSRSVPTPPHGCAHWRSSRKAPPPCEMVYVGSSPADGSKSSHVSPARAGTAGQPALLGRKAGDSHEATSLPPTRMSVFAASEKYETPPA